MKLFITTLSIVFINFGAFAGFKHDTPIGKKGDVVLEMWSDILNGWEGVVLVFGYYDDYEACEEIKNVLTDRYSRRYRCNPIK